MVAALIRPHMLSPRDQRALEMPEGLTIAQMVALVWPVDVARGHAVVFIGEVQVPLEYWPRVRPKAGALVRMALTFGGGDSKGILASVAMIALAVIAPPLGAWIAPTIGVSSVIATAGITMIGALAIGALFRPPAIAAGAGAQTPTESATYSLSGQANQATPYGVVPRVYGMHRLFPRLAAVPYVATEGPNQFLYMLLDCGYGPLQVEQLRIGDTAIENFRDMQFAIHSAWKAGDALTLYRNIVNYEQLGIALATGVAEVRISAENSAHVALEFSCPRGLVSFDDRGNRQGASVTFAVSIRPAGGGGAWTPINQLVLESSRPVATEISILPVIAIAQDSVDTVEEREWGTQTVPMDGFAAGRNVLWVQLQVGFFGEQGTIAVGDTLYFNNAAHVVTAVADHPATRWYKYATIAPPLAADVVARQVECPIIRPTTDEVIVSDATAQPLFFSIGFRVDPGQYEIQVTRRSPISADPKRIDGLTWNALRSSSARPPIALREPHTIIELKIRASDQLSGVVQNVNCVATSILPVWRGDVIVGAVPIGLADLNGDGISDILWRMGDDVFAQIMVADAAVGAGIMLGSAPGKTFAVAGDFNGDGRPELLFRDAAGALEMWFLAADGMSVAAKAAVNRALAPGEAIVGAGDTGGDGKADLIVRSGDAIVWKMNGASVVSASILRTVPAEWAIKQVADFNGDGKADLFWRNYSSGENYLYYLDGATILPSEALTRQITDMNWDIGGAGEFGADAAPQGSDILWRHSPEGDAYVYPMLPAAAISDQEGYVEGFAAHKGETLIGIGNFSGIGRKCECLFWDGALARIARIDWHGVSAPNTAKYGLTEITSFALPGAWVTEATRNPAWAYLDALRGNAALRPLADARINFDSLLNWATYCDASVPNGINGEAEPRVRFDHVVDYGTTTFQLLQSIAAAGRATPTICDGRHGVIVDEEQSIPVQLFTPRNSWGFTARRTYLTEPHGLRVKFVDPNSWQEGEVVLYASGYNALTAVTFEELKLFGVTRYSQATRDGRYMKAQALLRREEFEIQCDIESLIATRGDLVVVQHDVLEVGGDSSRVESIAGDVLTLADPFGALPIARYGVRIRLSDGTITAPIEVFPESPNRFRLSTVPDPAPAPGDLVAWGFLTAETGEYLVKNIAPGPDFTASLSLAEIARGIYAADLGDIAPYVPPAGGRPSAGIPPAPERLRAVQLDKTIGREPYADVVLYWEVASQAIYSKYRVVRVEPSGIETLIAETATTSARVEQNLRLVEPGATDRTTRYAVVGVDAIGKESAAAGVDVQLRDPLYIPDGPQFLSSNAHGKTTTLTWRVPDNDANPGNGQILAYEVRWVPAGDVVTWSAGTRVTELVPWNVSTVTVPSRNGTYLLKSVTASRIECEEAAATTIAVEDLVIQDLFHSFRFEPAWRGLHDGTVLDAAGRLTLAKNPDGTFVPFGVFYSNDREIFNDLLQTRVAGHVSAFGVNTTAFMADWDPLALADPIAGSFRGADWDASLWINSSELAPYAMADWIPLAAAAPLDPVPAITEAGWRPLIFGEYIGRQLFFAAVLESRRPTIAPVVSSIGPDIDFPEREEAYSDILVPNGGMDFLFARPFVFPPAVAIDLQNAAQNDYIARGPVSTSGFHVEVRQGGSAASGLVDIRAYGVGRTL